jgi:quercetin dioxygenase-like cupin family protein
MQAVAVASTLTDAPAAVVVDASSRDEVRAARRDFGSFDGHAIGGRRWSGTSPWERHPDGDELLMPLEGSYVVTVLTGDASEEVEVRAGSFFIVPRGLWHRTVAADTVMDFGINAVGRDEISFADDPRVAPPRP